MLTFLAKVSGSGGIFAGAGFLPDLEKNARFRPEPESGKPYFVTIGDKFSKIRSQMYHGLEHTD